MVDVILVDLSDQPLGQTSKTEAHHDGRLHRAFTVFLFSPQGELVMQRRAVAKPHSGGLWSTSCCSHPRANESILRAARRRLHEELGFDQPASFKLLGCFVFRHRFGPHLVEYVYDHVVTGQCPTIPILRPDPLEVTDLRLARLSDLAIDLVENADQYSLWLPQATALLLDSRSTAPRPPNVIKMSQTSQYPA